MAATNCFPLAAVIALYALKAINCSNTNAVPFGSECTSDTKCGAFGTFAGGVGTCLRLACECGYSGRYCTGDNECCSRVCNNSICTKATLRKAPCKEGTCGETYGCRTVEPDNVTLVTTPGNPWGLCELSKPMWNQCDNETFCDPALSWPGGWQNCFNGRCDCKFDLPCNSDRECCSNWCQDGQCQASTVGGFCSWQKNRLCLDKYGCTGKSWNLGNMGICEKCSTIGSPCNNKTYCCPLGHWPGGYGNCLDNICNCKVVGNCQSHRECCSGNCANHMCATGSLLDLCIKDPDSCHSGGFQCNLPSDEYYVWHHFLMQRGTCKAKQSLCGKQAIRPQFASVSNSKYRKKIFSGETAIANSWPWMVNIRGPVFCGAVLILPAYILTAAHCLTNRSANQLIVTLGSHNIHDTDSVIVGVTQIFKHPAYRESAKDQADIAILQLNDTSFMDEKKRTPKIELICLTDKQYPKDVGHECVAIGWGQTTVPGDNVQRPANQLQQVKVKLFSNNSRCSPESIICAVGNGGISPGDSGGPLMCKNLDSCQWELKGIASHVPNYGDYQQFTDVSYYNEWILQTTQDVEPKFQKNIRNRPGRSCKRFLSK